MLETLNAILIEDEPRSQKVLSMLIEQNCPQIKLLKVCNDARQGIEAVSTHQPNLVFLDIRMPGLSGFEFLDAYDEPPFEIIFVTAYDQYAIEALRRSAVDYLLKPVNEADLVRSVKSASQRIEQKASKDKYKVLRENRKVQHPQHQKLVIPTRDGLQFIPLEEVVKLQADRNYTRIFTLDGKEVISTNHLKLYEESLPSELFFRTHHSFIINLQHVKNYVRGEGGYVVLSGGGTADISKRRKRDFLEAFGH